ncbi:uncharacterized protein N7473_009830 [Penicillium subrubescens]|uniref:uncharacterized protein n=1 Tax=Penicillium subrubescens TaxID=1316194 RepID=UPI002544D426|nr:uncharacterized protein N7473_009830 [Penicillium subrubescens]KAJ5882944.1 hypothetical protein N7473_009830 [Penicillium subrubescens]
MEDCFIFENGGSGTIKQSLDAIAYGGIIAVIGFLSVTSREEMLDVGILALSKGANVRGVIIGSNEILEDVVRFISSHNLALPVERTSKFTRDGVIDAFDDMASGQHIGKVCINF